MLLPPSFFEWGGSPSTRKLTRKLTRNLTRNLTQPPQRSASPRRCGEVLREVTCEVTCELTCVGIPPHSKKEGGNNTLLSCLVHTNA